MAGSLSFPAASLLYIPKMFDAIITRLEEEVSALNHELNVTLPAALEKAIANGDLKENGDYHAALERQGFVSARLSQLRGRLVKLSQIDTSKIPEHKVGLGSQVEVLDLETKEKEKFELVVPDAMDVVLEELRDDFAPGDVVVLNDPYHGGMHLPDIFMFMPVFVEGGLFGFTVLLCFVLAQRLSFNPEELIWDNQHWLRLGLVILLLALPFFFAANLIGLALMRFRRSLARL